MGLDEIVTNAVATIKSVTSDLQPQVEHWAWIGHEDDGAPKYASTAKKYNCIVEYRRRRHSLIQSHGQEVWSRAYVVFLEPVKVTGVNADRVEPIDPRDRIVLPDGSTGPIVDVRGIVSKKTKRAYFHEVWIGQMSGL